MLEFFIAKRYLRIRHKLNFITVISILSTLGITIGVAALVIVLAVFNGFGSVVTSILVSFDPHLRIGLQEQRTESNINFIESKLEQNQSIDSFYPYVEGKTILIGKRNYEIANLKGIGAGKDINDWGVATKIISGSFDIYNDSVINKMVLGLPLALRLSVRVGDTLTITSAKHIESAITRMSIPRSVRFIITGIFESNNRDYDLSYIFTSLNSGKKLFGNELDGYEIRLDNFDQAEKVKSQLQNQLFNQDVSVLSWYDLHKDLYDIMLLERWIAYLLLSLIIAVAAFNIFASLTMTVIEKKRDIGILKTLGMNKKSIIKIFTLEGILTGIVGTTIGLIIGIGVCLLQINYNFYPLDPSKYIISALPVELRFADIVAISLVSLILSFTAAVYPAKRAAETQILESIKYE
jgi:lipoprotein-releasing system permease protein